LGDALQSLLAIPRDDPLVGVVICSDGIENVRRDPETVARLYHRKGVPIHTVTVGTTNDVQDIILENVQVKRAVPNQAPTRIGVSIRAAGYAGLTVPVQIVRANKVVASQQIKLKNGSQRIEVDFTPRERGFQTYEVKIPVQNGEWLATNNRRVFGLEILDPTIRVIYMEGTPQQSGSPMPEWKYLKDALESDANIKVKTLYRRFGANGQFLNTLDADPETGERIYPVEHATKGFPRTMAGQHSPTLPTPQSMWRSPSLLPPRSGIGCAPPSAAIHLFRSVPVHLLLLRVLAPLPFLDPGTRDASCLSQ
jgi:hypothetical protein